MVPNGVSGEGTKQTYTFTDIWNTPERTSIQSVFAILRREAMTDYDMSIHTNPDAMAWAKLFIEFTKDLDRDA